MTEERLKKQQCSEETSSHQTKLWSLNMVTHLKYMSDIFDIFFSYDLFNMFNSAVRFNFTLQGDWANAVNGNRDGVRCVFDWTHCKTTRFMKEQWLSSNSRTLPEAKANLPARVLLIAAASVRSFTYCAVAGRLVSMPNIHPGVSQKRMCGLNSLLSELSRYWYKDEELSRNTCSQWPGWVTGMKEWKPLSLNIFLPVIWYVALVITWSRRRGTGGAKSRHGDGDS